MNIKGSSAEWQKSLFSWFSKDGAGILNRSNSEHCRCGQCRYFELIEQQTLPIFPLDKITNYTEIRSRLADICAFLVGRITDTAVGISLCLSCEKLVINAALCHKLIVVAHFNKLTAVKNYDLTRGHRA